MINLIPGKKGTGKTKILVDSIKKAAENATGNVVCIERGMQLTYDLPHNVRLADAEEYGINSFDSFYGFVAGLMAGNYDIQEVFVDGILKIGGRDYDALGNMLEKEKKNADQDAAVSYTTQILSLQSDNAKNEYDIKAKNVEIKKLEASTKNAYVTASIDGTVKNVKTVDKLQQDGGDVIMQITEEGDYRIKGRFNEQNSKDIMQGASVIVKSRLDDSTWKGEITSVDTSPQKNSGDDIYSFGSSDEMSQSSNYAFYVKPESFDGLMLGQHVLIEIDNGQDTSINKTGIWLYSDFICKDGKKNYVWAKDKDGKIEKRYVEIGQKDEENGDCEIKSGLEKGDYIAYPDKSIEEGMTATTNEADVSVPPNDLDPNDNTDGDADIEGGDEDIAFDGSDEDGMAIDEDMLASMTDEEIEEYFNKLYGEEENAENADGENADAADADAAFAE